MTSPTEISVKNLSRLIGLPDAPVIVDVRVDDDFARDKRVLPGSVRRNYREVAEWCNTIAGRRAVIVCQQGLKLSQGTAALLRHEGICAETLQGGFEAWTAARQLVVSTNKMPQRDSRGRTVWVTRARPKIDRIACPWLIRRFIDPDAVFLFVSPSETQRVAERFDATPFDIENVFWSHRGEQCTFDTMLAEFGLQSEALNRLAAIVRGADTDRLDTAPESAGLLAASLGYSRMYRDDLAQLNASMSLYDAFYRWCRDAGSETHTWPSTVLASVAS